MRKSVMILVCGLLIIGMVEISKAATITNGVLTVGVNSDGTINDYSTGIGLTYVNYSGADYTYPGTPFQYYSIGVGDAWASNISGSGDMSASTTTTSSSAYTTGSYSGLAFTQNMTLYGNTLNFSVTLTNSGSSVLNNISYANGFDPDQDAYTYGTYDTMNIKSDGIVTAFGAVSNNPISIIGDGKGSVSSEWDTNPYSIHNDGYGDYTISMLWDIGSLAPGESKTIDFDYSPIATPVPAAVWLLGSGLVGLVGLKKRRGKK